MPSVPTTSLDLTDPAFIVDPYPDMAAERARHEVAWSESAQSWLAFSHAAVGAVQRDRRLGRIWSDLEPTDYLEPFNLLHRNQMMENEGAAHTRLRRPVADAFKRGHVERLRPRVVEIANELLDEADPSGFDLMAGYAEPLPVLVICELLGFPRSHVEDLRRWSQAIVRMYEPAPSQQVVDEAVAAAAEFAELARDVVRLRRANPVDDLISDLAAPGAAAGLTEDEIVASVILLLNAGHEASVNVFGNGMAAILQGPGFGALADVGTTPAGRALAVEEMLRFDSAGQLFERTATEPVEIAGVRIETGQRIAVLIGSANRDASVFDAADELRLDRDPNPHVAFGVGVHFCIGAPLARMELAESLGVLLDRFRGLELAGEPTGRGTFVLRGHHTVPVREVG